VEGKGVKDVLPDSDTDQQVPFPPGAPKPHEGRRWATWVKRQLVDNDLVDIANARVPIGKFQPLWQASALAPPPPLDGRASYGDKLKYRDFCDKVDRHKLENATIKAQRDDW
jgi:hypothetical protein